MSTDNSKQCPCIDCGALVTVTKFASPKKVKCNDCKEKDVSKVDLPSKDTVEARAQFSNIMLAKLAEMRATKEEPERDDAVDALRYAVEGEAMAQVKVDVTPPQDMIVHPNNKKWIEGKPNKALYTLSCPYHINHQMETINVIKDSRWGDKIIMQCPICFTVVDIIDGSNRRAHITMKDGVDWAEDTNRMLEKIESSNIT